MERGSHHSTNMADPFLRPEVTAWLRRWAETLTALLLAALGLLCFLTAGPVLAWAGAALALAAGAAAFASFRRARFLSPGGGVGVVQLDEGRLTYYGPLSGGSVTVREIVAIGLDPRHHPAHWVVRDEETELLIPVDAEGAGTLFDVFALLPGLDLGAVVSASEQVRDTPMTFWRRGGAPKARRLPDHTGPDRL